MPSDDKSGRKNLSRNVLGSWLSYGVFIVFGFVMPRVIDESIGQVGLGIWDFSWTIVSYLNLAMMGIGSSVNRYVAKYRAIGDVDSLSDIVSSVNAIQIGIGFSVLIATYVIGTFVPRMLSEQLGDQTDIAVTVVYLLGASAAVRMAFDVFRGIMTGYHLWTSHNMINAASYAISAMAMIALLLAGGGLIGMAGAYLVVTVLTEATRFVVVKRVCKEVVFRFRGINRREIAKVFRFGIKTILLAMPRVLLLQSVNVLVVAHLGPAMLAILSRPMALMNHVSTLVNKFAFVLVPTAGALQASSDEGELKGFSIEAMRAGWIITVLPLVFLLGFGDKVIELWMGKDYVNNVVMLVLVASSLVTISQRSMVTILVGMNRHGTIAKISLVLLTLSFAICWAAISYLGWTLSRAAYLIAIPSVIGVGLGPVIVGCSILKITVREYLRAVLWEPIKLLVITLPVLLLAKELGPAAPALSILVGMLVQGVLTLILLRKYIQPLVASIRG